MVIVGCVVWGWVAHLVSTGWVICACSRVGLGKIRPVQDSIPHTIYVMKSNKLFTVTDYICQL